jgi:hypothetical protein
LMPAADSTVRVLEENPGSACVRGLKDQIWVGIYDKKTDKKTYGPFM